VSTFVGALIARAICYSFLASFLDLTSHGELAIAQHLCHRKKPSPEKGFKR
jgi:hypothetical protein